ncbi:hypothetical protein ACOSQ3_021149 [Xanthoceras sorbifolium]
MRKIEVQVGQLAKALQQQVSGKFLSKPEQVKAITALQSGKVVNNKIRGELFNNSIYNASTSTILDLLATKEQEIVTPEKAPVLQKAVNPYVPLLRLFVPASIRDRHK